MVVTTDSQMRIVKGRERRNMLRGRWSIIFWLVLGWGGHAFAIACSPSPPSQPIIGPASATYAHSTVNKLTIRPDPFDVGTYTLYEPAGPAPAQAPVVLFLHGYFNALPGGDDVMLQHIARKGYIVIYPSYGVAWDPANWETHAINALDAAMHKLAEPGHVAPDRSKFAIVGYSIGGVLALRLAHRAPGAGLVNLPIPRAVVLQDGAGMNSPAYPFLRLDDLSQIDPNTKLQIVMAEETYKRRLTEATQCNYDFLQSWMWVPACDGFGVSKLAWTRTLQVVTKNAVVIPTDTYGTPDLISDHTGVLVDPSAVPPKPLDAIDWAYWKLTVGALNYAVHGTDGIYAFGAAPELRDMGVWSDGTAVRLIDPIDGCFVGGSCP